MPFVEIMPDRQHTMHAVAIGAFVSAPDVGAGALGRRPASSADRFRVSSQDRGLPLAIQNYLVATVRSAGLLFRGEWVQPD